MLKNFDWCVYTYKHRIMFRYILEKLVKDQKQKEELLVRAKFHDMDKLFTYLFVDQLKCQLYHVAHQPHHLECPGEKTEVDLVETVIDFECSPYTKPDKPLNAYDFVWKLSENGLIGEERREQLFSIMREFGIASSYRVTETDKEGMEFAAQIGEVTEEMILSEVREYLKTNPVREIEWVKSNCKTAEKEPVWRELFGNSDIECHSKKIPEK